MSAGRVAAIARALPCAKSATTNPDSEQMHSRFQLSDKPKRRNKLREQMRARFVETFGEAITASPSMQPMLNFAVSVARSGDPVVVMLYGGHPFVGRKWPTEIEP